MSLYVTTLTIVHVLISLVGIGAGFVMLFGMLRGQRLGQSTTIFLWTTVLTSVTGFFFPVDRFLPSHAVGIISLIVLPIAIVALYRRHLAGSWRWIFVVTALLAQYLNVFVLVVQLFQKVPALKAMAPTQTEPPFAVTQLVVLAAFVVLGVAAVIRFRQEPSDGVPASPSTVRA